MRMFIGCVIFAMCSVAEAGTVKLMVEPALVGKEVLVSAGFNVHEPIMKGLGVNLYAGVDADQTGLVGESIGKIEFKAVMGGEKLSIQPGARLLSKFKGNDVIGFIRFEYKL